MSKLLTFSKCVTCILATYFLTCGTFLNMSWGNNISANLCLFNKPTEIDELIKLANQSN